MFTRLPSEATAPRPLGVGPVRPHRAPRELHRSDNLASVPCGITILGKSSCESALNIRVSGHIPHRPFRSVPNRLPRRTNLSAVASGSRWLHLGQFPSPGQDPLRFDDGLLSASLERESGPGSLAGRRRHHFTRMRRAINPLKQSWQSWPLGRSPWSPHDLRDKSVAKSGEAGPRG